LPDFGYQIDVVCASLIRPPEREEVSQIHTVPDSSEVLRVETPWVLGRDPYRPPVGGNLSRSASWKVRAYAEWLFLTHDWSWKWGAAALRQAGSSLESKGYDLLIVDAPPFPAVIPFIRSARKAGVPTVLDLRDLWGREDESHHPPWWPLSPRLRRIRWSLRLRDEAVRAAAHVVLTSPDLVEVMRSRFPDLAHSHFSFIPNAYETVDSVPASTGVPLNPDHLLIVYTGSLAYGRGEQAKRFIRGMREFRRLGMGNVELIVAGAGAEGLMETAESEGIADGVEIHGWLDRDEAVELQRAAGALLLLQPTSTLEARVAIPGKLFEYMARRRPILAMVGSGPAGEIIREHGLGVVPSGEGQRPLAEALGELAEQIRAAPYLPAPPEMFSERSTVAEFARVLDRVMARGSEAGRI